MIEKFEYSLQSVFNFFKNQRPDFNISGELNSITTSSEEVRVGYL